MNKTACVMAASVTIMAMLIQAGSRQSSPGSLHFRKTVLDTAFRSEGVCVADFNRDGRPDILAGDLWYEAPSWKPHEIAPVKKYDPAAGYSECFATFAADVDRDGYPDQIRIGMPGGPADWRRNPGKAGGPWKSYQICGSACNETPLFEKLLGPRSQPVLVFPKDEAYMAWYEPSPDPTKEFIAHIVSTAKSPGTQRFSHGLGVGDVNGDGRADILTTEGFYQAPQDPRAAGWSFVPASLGQPCANMVVYDVNQDGLPDVVSSSAHGVGVWWFEQKRTSKGAEFVEHLIDKSVSQTHALVMADLDRDGVMEFVTGKRFWAHGPSGDIEPNAPAMLVYFKPVRSTGQVQWTRHVVDDDSGVGTQFTVADVNQDGRLDIVTSNKKGVFYFEQVR